MEFVLACFKTTLRGGLSISVYDTCFACKEISISKHPDYVTGRRKSFLPRINLPAETDATVCHLTSP